MKTSIKRALLSVSDKTDIVKLAKTLSDVGVEIVSTGGTYKTILAAGIPAKEVSTLTGFPEIMEGRVKTLHPNVHGGILARRQQDEALLDELGIGTIDLVVVNLYPFSEKIQQDHLPLKELIENIDIGGPTMVRSAAKNHQWVNIIIDPNDYSELEECLKNKAATTLEQRFRWAVKAFNHTAQYDGIVSQYLSSITAPKESEDYQICPKACEFPETLHLGYKRKTRLRYGENPHQQAAFYLKTPANNENTPSCIAHATQHQGKPLSFNNIADADAAYECVKTFTDNTACVIVKHANPCGVAIGNTPLDSYLQAYSTDPTSAFGGIIAFNSQIDAACIEKILENQFVEVIVAPEATEEAIAACKTKPNIRLLTAGSIRNNMTSALLEQNTELKSVNSGILLQSSDSLITPVDQWHCVTTTLPSEAQMQDLNFAWKVARFVKSNAIVIAHGGKTLGIGAGQMSRIDSAKIASFKAETAQFSIEGAVLASDAFFPFSDTIEWAAQVGISAIVQPGESIRDDEVIKAANAKGITLMFTGTRHFRH